MFKLLLLLFLSLSNAYLSASAAPAKSGEQLHKELVATNMIRDDQKRAARLVEIMSEWDCDAYPDLAQYLIAECATVDFRYRPLLTKVRTKKGPRDLFVLAGISNKPVTKKQAKTKKVEDPAPTNPEQQSPAQPVGFLAIGRLLMNAFKEHPIIAGVAATGLLASGIYYMNQPSSTSSSASTSDTPTPPAPEATEKEKPVREIGPEPEKKEQEEKAQNQPSEEEKLRNAYAYFNLSQETPWEEIQKQFAQLFQDHENAKAKMAAAGNYEGFNQLCEQSIVRFGAMQIVLKDQEIRLSKPSWQQNKGHSLRSENELFASVQTKLDPFQLLGLPYTASVAELQKAANEKIGLHLHALACAENDHDEQAYRRQLNLIQLYVNAADCAEDRSIPEAAAIQSRLAAMRSRSDSSIHEHKNMNLQG